MFRFSYLFILVHCFCAIYSCAPKAVETNDPAALVRQEAEKMLHQYAADVNAEGFIAEFKYLDTSDRFSWHPPGFETAINYDSVAAILKKNVVIYPKVYVQYNSLNIIPTDKETAMYSGDVTVVTTDVEGRLDTMHLLEKGTLIKRADGWKLLSGKTVLNNK